MPALDWTSLSALLVAALSSGALTAFVQHCLTRQREAVDTEAIERQTAALEARIRKGLTAENLQLRQEMADLTRSHQQEVAALRAEITLLKRRLDDCEGRSGLIERRRLAPPTVVQPAPLLLTDNPPRHNPGGQGKQGVTHDPEGVTMNSGEGEQQAARNPSMTLFQRLGLPYYWRSSRRAEDRRKSDTPPPEEEPP